MEKIVGNIAEETDRQLEIIIATHAHRDHISGFGKFQDVFAKFKIGEIWLSWTWNPKDKKARKLQEKHTALTDKLDQHFRALSANGSVDLGAFYAVMNLAGNMHAVEALRSGFGNDKVKVRYLKAGDTLKSGDIYSSMPGLSVRILGPPQSKDFLGQMNPPSGQGYLRAGPNGMLERVDSIQPFGIRWRVDPLPRDPHLPAKEKKQLQGLSRSSINDVAFSLDQARNNESLVILFIFHSKYLLFPGDAQYGNWRWWLEHEKYSSSDILSRINFFKIAHHGSHNATPREALEKMADGQFAAMVSTQSKPWKSIPRVTLMSRLDEKTKNRIVRSDWCHVSGAPGPLSNSVPTLPSKLPDGFEMGKYWLDYNMEV